jgi:hypothetical protein
MSNATYLFIQPSRNYHCSESFWSSFFALCLLCESRVRPPLRIPAFNCVIEGKHGHFQPDGELVVPRALERSEVVVEGKVRSGFLPRVSTVPNELLDLRPDIMVRMEDSLIVVEVKTVGHELGWYQKECYEKLQDFASRQGYRVDMYYLLSAGHEKDRDFTLLKHDSIVPGRFRLLLWEMVFAYFASRAPRSPLIDSLGDIAEFYQNAAGYMRW